MRILHPLMIALMCMHAHAEDNTFAFKGFKLGSSEAELTAAFKEFDCNKGDGLLADRSCSTARIATCDRRNKEGLCGDDSQAAWNYAGVSSTVIVHFYNDSAHSISVSFASREFSKVLNALIEKYGPPESRKTEIVQNRAGSTFENDIVIWSNENSEIKAERYGGSIDRSNVRYKLNSMVSEFARRKALKAKESAKDL